MTPRGGPTLDFSLFGRYFLDLAVFYPGAFLCLAPLWEHVKAPRRTAVLTAALVTVICLAAAALCAIFELDSNILLLPTLLAAFWLLGIFLLLYEMYQVAREYTRSAQLDRENQLLAVESRRYTELRAYMEQTRHLRHDFRQHLHVIAGLTEAGQVDELKNYLHQYESELSEERPTLCANPAVDALAGHYDHEAHSLGVPVDWRLELPRQLAIPEADFCMMLGNLLENAFHASQKLPPEQRQVKVMARMLSPAMLGLLVENRYDGVLKRQQGTLHSTKHDGMGIGLVSIQTAVSRYGGSMTVETENCLFRVNILLNL